MSCAGAPFDMKTQSKPKHFEEEMIGHLLETTYNLVDAES